MIIYPIYSYLRDIQDLWLKTVDKSWLQVCKSENEWKYGMKNHCKNLSWSMSA